VSFPETPEFRDVAELLRWCKRKRQSSSLLVGIDGYPTAGKTWLAREATAGPDAFRLSTDSYVRSDNFGRDYVHRIDLTHLSSDLSKVCDLFSLVVLEGICLRLVEQKLDMSADIHIYVKRYTATGLWADETENHLEGGKPSPDLPWVDRQSVLYHLNVEPLGLADCVYRWSPDPA